MIDISQKPVQRRKARATGRIVLTSESLLRIKEGKVEKGDVFQVATVAAIMAVKRTPEIIPYCHPIPIEDVNVKFQLGENHVKVDVEVKASAKTGVEMEALTGLTAALLAIWDMVKKYEKDEAGQYPRTAITDVRVVKKVKQ
ncbi:MAG TPA: cyclic pyranopterin monophosphate synthase MoaC [Candidatus Korarchaeota archaeon]|nr:cyclic pyranopterin monophosphate synthase MoaC [Candidatus Korarchaeota archaeon]